MFVSCQLNNAVHCDAEILEVFFIGFLIFLVLCASSHRLQTRSLGTETCKQEDEHVRCVAYIELVLACGKALRIIRTIHCSHQRDPMYQIVAVYIYVN